MRLVFRLLILPLLLLAAGPGFAQELLTYSAPDCDYGGNFKAMEAVDALTVRFTLCQPDPAFPFKVAFSAFAIHPSEYLMAAGGSGDLLRAPVGTGPYRLAKWTAGEEIVLARNDAYWGIPAQEAEVIVRWSPEAGERLAALLAGQADGIDNPAPADFPAIQADPNLMLYERPSTNIFYLGINNSIPPFNDPRVRQAIAYAIDRESLVREFYPAGSTAAGQFMPPSIFGYTPEVAPYAYNPAQAQALLQAAGVPLPIETTLSYASVVRSYLPQPGRIAERIQEQLRAVGIHVTLDQEDWTAYLDAAQAGRLSLHLLGWGADYPDATNFLDYHFGAGASPQFGERLPQITGVLRLAAMLTSPEERYPLYMEANTAIRELAPMVPIAHATSGTAFRASILGAHSSPLTIEHFSIMTDPDDDQLVWLQNAEPSSLYCADESDGESLRICEQINESLLAYEISGTRVMPALAQDYGGSADATIWTFRLRPDARFHDGSTLDANDVVLSYLLQWDAAHPLHVGRTGDFTYFSAFFGGFING